MPRSFKLAIVRARHDGSVGTIPDQACLEMLMTGANSVMSFWSDTSGGWFDFLDSAMMPWVDMTIDPAATDRDSQARAAFAALRAANPGHDPLAGFDGALVITLPGRMTVMGAVVNFDGGSTGIDGLPVSVIPVMASDHTFICHELGHTLGADHSFGLDNNGTDWDPGDATIIVGPEYGSPYDLMSSASFGSRWLGTGPFWSANPTFAGPAVAGWPFAGATAMGPHLSRANLHRWFPEALEPGKVAHRPFPGGDEVGYLRLTAVGKPGGTSLLILHPPGEPASGAGRIYVEFRVGQGWDRGLKVFGADLARVGVVVHTLEDVAGAGPRVWYRGAVVAGSIDTDLVVATRPVVITLEGWSDDPDNSYADIAYRAAAERAVSITPANASDGIVGGSAIREERTPCGDVITWGSWSTQSFCQFRIATTGFGGTAAMPPTVAWSVAGTTLGRERGHGGGAVRRGGVQPGVCDRSDLLRARADRARRREIHRGAGRDRDRGRGRRLGVGGGELHLARLLRGLCAGRPGEAVALPRRHRRRAPHPDAAAVPPAGARIRRSRSIRPNGRCGRWRWCATS